MPGAGIFGTFGYAAESEWGAFEAPDHFLTMLKESGAYDKTVVQSKALSGQLYPLADRRAVTKIGATQTLDVDVLDAGMGLLWANALGANAVTGSDAPYTQVFTPADTTGESLSIQVGRPMTNNSTIQAISYTGCKVTDWTLGSKAGALDTCTFSFDAKEEDSTQDYTAPSYTTSNILTAIETTVTIGGTVSTSDGVTSVSGGTQLALITDFSAKSANALNKTRYVLGSAYKLEQIVNGLVAATGSMTLEFNDLSTAYTAFKADTSFAVEMAITGPVISGSTHSSIKLLLSCCFWDKDSFPVTGEELLNENLTYTALYDGTNNPVQVTLVTTDSTI